MSYGQGADYIGDNQFQVYEYLLKRIEKCFLILIFSISFEKKYVSNHGGLISIETNRCLTCMLYATCHWCGYSILTRM